MATASSKFSYDVYLSYAGEDTRKTLADYLFEALVGEGLQTFRDDYEIERGKLQIGEIERKAALEKSKIWMIVLSKNYITSPWYLDKLEKILEWSKTSGRGGEVLPVFYDVDPSEVRRQKVSIGETTDLRIRRYLTEKLKGWRAALEEVSNLKGIVLQKGADGSESLFIKKIVEVARGFTETKDSRGTWITHKEDVKRKRVAEEKIERKVKAAVKGLDPVEAETKDGEPSSPQKKLFYQRMKRLLIDSSPDLSRSPLLLVLDISNTNIKSLPSSISILVTLRELFMRDCKLMMELPFEIGALWNLKTLDLEGTELICLPKEVGQLYNLKCLKFSLYKFADEYKESKDIKTIIPRETLSKISMLEELSIDVDPECGWWEAEVDDVIKDLSCLTCLETLKLYLPTVNHFKQFLLVECHGKRKRRQTWQGYPSSSQMYPLLRNFRLIAGCTKQRLISRLPRDLQENFKKLDRCLNYMNGEKDTEKEIAKALQNTRALFLDRHWTIEKLSAFTKQELENLCFCLLVQCDEMKSIVDGRDMYPHKYSDNRPTLASLEYLNIYFMKKLESIWEGPIVSGSLSSLKILSIHTCPRLSAVFSQGLLDHLINISELIIEDCCEIKSLVASNPGFSSSSTQPLLPNLKKISLLHLPELVNISRGLWSAPRLEKLIVYNCPKLKSLSPMEISSPRMVEIKGQTSWWERLEWHTSEWVHGRPDYLACIFVYFGEKDDLMDELAEAVKTSHVFENFQENLHSNMKNKEAMIDSDESDILSYSSNEETVMPCSSQSELTYPFVSETKKYEKHEEFVQEVLPTLSQEAQSNPKSDIFIGKNKSAETEDSGFERWRNAHSSSKTYKQVIPVFSTTSYDLSRATVTSLSLGLDLAQPVTNLSHGCDKLVEVDSAFRLNPFTDVGGDPVEMSDSFLPSHQGSSTPIPLRPPTSTKFPFKNRRKSVPTWTEQVQVSRGTKAEEAPDDAFNWRKYGQKSILGANYPRIYYRCTHKYSQGCSATKQVQRATEDSTIFNITYRGRHICRQDTYLTPPPPQEMVPNFQRGLNVKIDDLDPSDNVEDHDIQKTMPNWTEQVQVSQGTIDAGFSWRKYGQKDILGATYPRSYYRCAHQNSRGCLAKKQVQRSDEDSTIFNITYTGRHTCTQDTDLTPPPPQETVPNFQKGFKVGMVDLDPFDLDQLFPNIQIVTNPSRDN